jgi:hypothetical protein
MSSLETTSGNVNIRRAVIAEIASILNITEAHNYSPEVTARAFFDQSEPEFY